MTYGDVELTEVRRFSRTETQGVQNKTVDLQIVGAQNVSLIRPKSGLARLQDLQTVFP